MKRLSLVTLAVLVTITGLSLLGQSTSSLLQETAKYYQNLDAYEFDGVMNIQLIGTGLEVSTDVSLLLPKRGSLPPGSTLIDEIVSYHKSSIVKGGTKANKPIPHFVYPLIGRFNEITKTMLSAESAGSETLRLNNEPVVCEIWKVHYLTSEEHPHPKVVTYWISPATHLVLKESFTASVGPNIGSAVVVVSLHTAKFGIPTPQRILDWAMNIASKGDVTERKDWMGKSAPDFTLKSSTGSSVKLSSLRGKPVLLDFWAIACAPCRLEMPIVEDLDNSYKKRGIKVLGISWDAADKAGAWLARNNHTLTSLSDSDSAVSDLYKPRGIPALVLIGRDGKVKEYWEGPVPKATLQAALDRVLLN